MTVKRQFAQDFKGRVDFGIITIREDEYQAVLDRLPTETLVQGRQTYSISRLETVDGKEYLIALIRCPEQGTSAAQTVAHNLIEDLDPQWLIVVGIAGSVPEHEHTLGDVLLATRLQDFSVSASIENSQQQFRQEFDVRGGPMHPDVQSLVAALPAIEPHLEVWNTPEKLTVQRPNVKISSSNFYGDKDWKRKVRGNIEKYFGENSDRQQPKAFTGSVASSDILVKNTELIQQWLETARQVRAIEMELAGVYQAAWNAQKPVLAVRGISDIVGFKRSPEWTNYACHTAASFLIALLRGYSPITPLAAVIPSNDELNRDSENKNVELKKSNNSINIEGNISGGTFISGNVEGNITINNDFATMKTRGLNPEMVYLVGIVEPGQAITNIKESELRVFPSVKNITKREQIENLINDSLKNAEKSKDYHQTIDLLSTYPNR